MINIVVKNKIAIGENATIVCGNSDYIIKFDFDNEWAQYDTKTARFKWNGNYTDVIFDGDEVSVPVVYNTYFMTVGVYAGDLHTTTPAVFKCEKSILCGSDSPIDPAPDVYAQIMEKLNSLDGIEPATADKLGGIKVGANLSIDEGGTLSADASEVEIDGKTIVKDSDGKLKANVSLPSPTKNGALLIGSGSGSSDAGWTEADAAGGYGYKKVVQPAFDITWDGDTTGKVAVNAEEMRLVKVSDEILTVDQVIGATDTMMSGGEQTITVDQSQIIDIGIGFGVIGGQ